MRAIVLAGGAGTRLRHVLGDTPKPMAPVCGRPFLTYILDNLIGHGCRRVWLSVGVGQEVVIDYFGSAYGSLPIEYVIEDAPLGTGGALARAIAAVDEFPGFALNGDTFSDIDYQEMLEVHRSAASPLTIAMRRVEDAGRYGRIELEDDHVIGFGADGAAGSELINIGTYVVGKRLFAGWPESFSFEHDYLRAEAARLRPLAYLTDGWFIDIGVPEDYRAAQRAFATDA